MEINRALKIKTENETIKTGYLQAKQILRHYGKSFYLSCSFLPKKTRQALFSIYAFVRIPDELVDNPEINNSKKIKSNLKNYRESWYNAYFHNESSIPILTAVAYTFYKYKIPFHYTDTFFKSMSLDLTKKTYETFDTLKTYMQGSAIVVSLMMFHILGVKHKKALYHAQQLGMALQLTNFIRDFVEDYSVRGRVYFPENELKQFNLNSDTLLEDIKTNNFRRFIKFQIKRTKHYYAEARKGFHYLPKRECHAIKLGTAFYESILFKIENKNYDISNRIYLSLFEKLKITPFVLAKKTLPDIP